MLLHLESGTCYSRTDVDDIDNWILRDQGCQDYLSGSRGALKYTCPDCNKQFRLLSALCQHVATESCGLDEEEVFEDVRLCLKDYL
jgi:hypothetical protein